MSYGKMPKYAWMPDKAASQSPKAQSALKTRDFTLVIKRETRITVECEASDSVSSVQTLPSNSQIVQMRENARRDIASPSKSDAIAAFHALFTNGGTE